MVVVEAWRPGGRGAEGRAGGRQAAGGAAVVVMMATVEEVEARRGDGGRGGGRAAQGRRQALAEDEGAGLPELASPSRSCPAGGAGGL